MKSSPSLRLIPTLSGLVAVNPAYVVSIIPVIPVPVGADHPRAEVWLSVGPMVVVEAPEPLSEGGDPEGGVAWAAQLLGLTVVDGMEG